MSEPSAISQPGANPSVTHYLEGVELGNSSLGSTEVRFIDIQPNQQPNQHQNRQPIPVNNQELAQINERIAIDIHRDHVNELKVKIKAMTIMATIFGLFFTISLVLYIKYNLQFVSPYVSSVCTYTNTTITSTSCCESGQNCELRYDVDTSFDFGTPTRYTSYIHTKCECSSNSAQCVLNIGSVYAPGSNTTCYYLPSDPLATVRFDGKTTPQKVYETLFYLSLPGTCITIAMLLLHYIFHIVMIKDKDLRFKFYSWLPDNYNRYRDRHRDRIAPL